MYILLIRFFIYIFATPFFMRIAAFARLTTLCGLLGTFLPFLMYAQAPVQEPVVKFGQVSAADFKQLPVPNDTTAEAVVLYESAVTQHEYRNDKITVFTQYYSRIRINKKSGYRHATVQVPLWGVAARAEYMANIEGVTHTLRNGQVTTQRMDKSAIVLDQSTADMAVQKFTLPGVEEGSIIEYRYIVYSPATATPHSWRFQQQIPVLWSDYKLTLSNYFYLKIILGGYLPLTINTAKPISFGLVNGLGNEGAMVYHFAVANAPAFRNEPFITTPTDYLSKIDFELAKIEIPGNVLETYSLSWADVDRTLLTKSTFGEQYQKASFLRDVADAIKAKHPDADTLGRVGAAYAYVRNTLTWNEENSLLSDRLKRVLELKKGTVSDLNFTLIGLLRELNIDANPVILSTRSHGAVNKEYGLLRQFNYVVAHLMLDGKDFMLDATDRFIKPGVLPERALNQTGRLILPEGKSRFVSLLPTERDIEAKVVTLTVTEDGTTTGTLRHSYGGYGAVDARKSYSLRGETNFVADVKRKKPNWQVEQVEFANVDDPAASMTVDYKLAVTDVVQVVGDRMYLHPMMTEGQADNPFKQLVRQYPVDFGAPFDETFTATYTLPEGYRVDELPAPLALSLPNNGGRFTYQVQQIGRQLSVSSRITIRKPVFLADEYSMLKELYDKILLKHGEQVVLVKGALAEKK
ncbi:transglutaminase [Fibrivirga algicola]|uniref:Transglutaminase n=1 Tax=Fibrivirga algicola TaxID=2950420 RepID=A0ABX0Q9Y7_9BACT|nr:transglutaminase [Fibrivirga algicola]NID08731.1 transglutaminase [Fibrivirga algicola]